jgi:electron transfer flavoprotein beta subunit
VKELTSSSLGVELAPKVVVKVLAEPPARKGGVKVADVDELWRRLHEEAKVL